MSKEILEDIINESLSGTMNIKSIQLAVSQIAHFLLNKSQNETIDIHRHGVTEKNNSQIFIETIETEKLREEKNEEKELYVTEEVKKEIEKLHIEMKDILSEFKIEIKNQFSNQLEDFSKKFVDLEEKLKFETQFMTEKMTKTLDDASVLRNFIETKLNEDENESVDKAKCELEGPKLNLENIKKEGKHPINSWDWVYKDSFRFTCLLFTENKIKTKGYANVFGASYLTEKFKFEVVFEEISFGVQVGISDVENASKEIFDMNLIRYTSNRYLKVDDEPEQNFKNFNKGEVITVIGNFKEAKIEFQINGETVCSYQYQKMKYLNIKWVPYLYLARNSCVHLLQ